MASFENRFLAGWAACFALLFLSGQFFGQVEAVRDLRSDLSALEAHPVETGEAGTPLIQEGSSAKRTLLALANPGAMWIFSISQPMDADALCTVQTDSAQQSTKQQTWRADPAFLKGLFDTKKLKLISNADHLPQLSTEIQWSTDADPKLVTAGPDGSGPPAAPGTRFLGYNGAPNKPFIFMPGLKSSGSNGAVITGEIGWLFGMPGPLSEAEKAKMGWIAPTTSGFIQLEAMGVNDPLPKNYQWYQATQFIGETKA